MVSIPTHHSVIWMLLNVASPVLTVVVHVLVMRGAVLSIHVTVAVADPVFP